MVAVAVALGVLVMVADALALGVFVLVAVVVAAGVLFMVDVAVVAAVVVVVLDVVVCCSLPAAPGTEGISDPGTDVSGAAAYTQGWSDASGIRPQARIAVAAAMRIRLTLALGTLGSRIAIRRPSSCDWCA